MTARPTSVPVVAVPPFHLYTIPEAARALGVGKTWIYDRMQNGSIPVVQLGTTTSKRRIRADALAAYVDSLSHGG